MPHGLSNWNFYNPDYYLPMMEIRQIAYELGFDSDAAAAEFTAATTQRWRPALTPGREAVLADYRHAIYDRRQAIQQPAFRFILAGYENQKAKNQPGDRFLFNPYSFTGASELLRLGERPCSCSVP